MYLNKVQIMGNLTRKPELKVLDGGTKVSNLSVAVNKVWNDSDGKKQESVQFISVVVFGKQAETCAQWLEKGQKVYVEGEINNRVIDKGDGSKEYKTGVVAQRVQFGAKSGQGEEKDKKTTDSTSGPVDVVTGGYTGPFDYGEDTINIDDIPF